MGRRRHSWTSEASTLSSCPARGQNHFKYCRFSDPFWPFFDSCPLLEPPRKSLMGPSPPSPSFSAQPPDPSSSPSSSLLPNLVSSADDWFLHASDRDTQILTQALTRELSSWTTPPSSASLSPPPVSSAPCSLYSSVYETLRRCLEERPLQSHNLEALRGLQQQKQQQLQRPQNHMQQQKQQQLQRPQNHMQQQQQQKTVAMSIMRASVDRFASLEQNPLQKESPLSNNLSPSLSGSAETPASPFSTLSTNSAITTMDTESFRSHSKPNNSTQHLDSCDGQLTRTMATSSKLPEVSPMCSDCSLSSQAASKALCSRASAGAGASKVNKKRSRASNKSAITVRSADISNFRAMVQQLTGVPSSSSLHSLPHSGLPLVKPQPIRHSVTNTVSLPTLDTSACFLGPKSLKVGSSYAQKQQQQASNSAANTRFFAGFDLSRVQGCNVENSTPHRAMPFLVDQSGFNCPANGTNQRVSSPFPGLWDSADSFKARENFSSLIEDEQISARQDPPTATFDSLVMEEHMAPKSSYSAVDSWFSFDGAHANHSPNTEIARIA